MVTVFLLTLNRWSFDYSISHFRKKKLSLSSDDRFMKFDLLLSNIYEGKVKGSLFFVFFFSVCFFFFFFLLLSQKVRIFDGDVGGWAKLLWLLFLLLLPLLFLLLYDRGMGDKGVGGRRKEGKGMFFPITITAGRRLVKN